MIYHGDVLDVTSGLPADSFDACLTDPPYGISFMGKRWDHGVPSAEVWSEVLRVLKPGAHLMAFGGTRTFHRLTCALEDAGFEIRDCLMWLYGSGFPKSLDISKAIDKAAGVEREVGEVTSITGARRSSTLHDRCDGNRRIYTNVEPVVNRESFPVTPEAARWHGYGTALKPAWEPVVLAMKPCAGTFAANVLEHGVAGLNVDEGRIGTPSEVRLQPRPTTDSNGASWGKGEHTTFHYPPGVGGGRWPANLLLDESAAAMLDEAVGEARSAGVYRRGPSSTAVNATFAPDRNGRDSAMYADSGGPSRFFYCAKVSSRERNAGLTEGETNRHPTLKPVKLTEYLARLLLPPERDTPRRILVPFAGTGSEMAGALRAGWDEVVGIEREAEHVACAERRVPELAGTDDPQMALHEVGA